MRYIALKYFIVFCLVVSSGAMLLDVSQRVQEVRREIRRADRSIEREQENIRVLQAEWAYLNAPSRLEMISTSGLGMGVAAPDDIVSGFGVFGVDDVPSVFHVPTRKPKNNMVRNISYSIAVNDGETR